MLISGRTRSASNMPGPRNCVIPNGVGLGFKHEHAPDIVDRHPDIDFFEVHAENYMGIGGPPHRLLSMIRADYPVSLHGVGLSIGSAAPLDMAHLGRLKALVERYQPALFSEHLAWSSHAGMFFNDLLPIPYNGEALRQVCGHIDQVQDTLRMTLLLENPSTYVTFKTSTMTELEFLRAVARRTGCGLLLDVGNVFVSAVNHGFDPEAYIDEFPVEHVGELHLGGFAEDFDGERKLLIDDHGRSVSDAVWSLYGRALKRAGPVPTLIEWDNDVPSFSTLMDEARRAKQCRLDGAGATAAPDCAT